MAVVVAVGAFLMTLLGGAVAHRIGDRRHLILGFAAGLMLGTVGFDLLPEALHAQPANVFGVPAALFLFVGGFLAIHTVERAVAVHRAHEGGYAAHTHPHQHERAPPPALGVAAAGALIAHSVMDGFAIAWPPRPVRPSAKPPTTILTPCHHPRAAGRLPALSFTWRYAWALPQDRQPAAE